MALTKLKVQVVSDFEASAFHHEIDYHFFDVHESLAVLGDLFAVNLGYRINVSCKLKKVLNNILNSMLASLLTEFCDEFSVA
jgi:hypothetical protein